jgi:integrase/recombinase XerD
MSTLAPIMESFFTERLLAQRRASPHTVASYRDTFRLLLGFAQRRTGKTPARLAVEDLDAVMVGAFLDHLETERHNSVRTATTVWPPSTRCSPTRRCATPSMPR